MLTIHFPGETTSHSTKQPNRVAKWLVISQTLMELLAIRLSHHKTMAKSLVISRRGERSEGAEPDKRMLTQIFTLNEVN